MPKKTQPQQVYKTESQLKEEAAARQAAEAKALSKIHKSDFQKKRENFWYHYKWHTIAGLAAALLLIFFVRDMFFRTRPDATIIVVTGGFVSSEALESLTIALEELAADFNGDGKIAIASDFISLPQMADESAQNEPPVPDLSGGQQDMGNAMKLMTVLAASADVIYLLDEPSYKYISTMGQSDNPDESNDIFEAFSIPAGSETINHAGAAELDGMRFYLRTSGNDEKYYEYCKQLFQTIAGEQ